MKTAGHPGRERGAALAALIVVIVLLVASAAILWPKFSRYRRDFEAVKEDLAGARQEVRELSQRPPVDEFDASKAALAEARAGLAETGLALAEATKDRNSEAARAGKAEAALRDERARAEALAAELGDLKESARGLAEAKERLEADLVTTVESYENARKAASGKEDLLDKLDTTARKLSAAERSLAAHKETLAEKEAELADVTAKLEKALADTAERDGLLSKLRRELAEIPLMPLPDELAKQKYHDYLNSVADFTDRESRVAALFRAKIALAGSSYESKADAQWRREMKMKEQDTDRAASAVYEEVTGKIRVHPDAHDENVTLLEEAREKVAGSRYDKLIQQLIDREHELKAAGR